MTTTWNRSGLTATFALGDADSSRVVYGVIIGLVVIGIALVILALWLIGQTRVDNSLLAPLELMGDRRWKRRDPATQRRLLDEARPEGAEPLQRSTDPPSVDVEFEQSVRPVQSFDDLVEAESADEPSDVEAGTDGEVPDVPASDVPASAGAASSDEVPDVHESDGDVSSDELSDVPASDVDVSRNAVSDVPASDGNVSSDDGSADQEADETVAEGVEVSPAEVAEAESVAESNPDGELDVDRDSDLERASDAT
jgi:hypothetical protein